MLGKIGGLLLVIGILLILPFDDILWYVLLVPIFGLGVIPIIFFVGVSLVIIGGTMVGVKTLPLLTNPLVLFMFIISIVIFAVLIVFYGGII